MNSKWIIITSFIAFLMAYQETQCSPSTGYESEVAVDEYTNPGTDMQDLAQEEPYDIVDDEMSPAEQDDELEENGDTMQIGDIQDAGTHIQQRKSYDYTDAKGSISFSCKPGYALYYLKSRFKSVYKDRIWKFRCRRISSSALTNCIWMKKNSLQGMLNVQCPVGYAITQIKSFSYRAYKFDRRFSINCCKSNAITGKCKFTPFLNYIRQPMKYSAQLLYVITGIFSHYDAYSGDRQYVGTVCKYNNC